MKERKCVYTMKAGDFSVREVLATASTNGARVVLSDNFPPGTDLSLLRDRARLFAIRSSVIADAVELKVEHNFGEPYGTVTVDGYTWDLFEFPKMLDTSQELSTEGALNRARLFLNDVADAEERIHDVAVYSI